MRDKQKQHCDPYLEFQLQNISLFFILNRCEQQTYTPAIINWVQPAEREELRMTLPVLYCLGVTKGGICIVLNVPRFRNNTLNKVWKTVSGRIRANLGLKISSHSRWWGDCGVMDAESWQWSKCKILCVGLSVCVLATMRLCLRVSSTVGTLGDSSEDRGASLPANISLWLSTKTEKIKKQGWLNKVTSLLQRKKYLHIYAIRVKNIRSLINWIKKRLQAWNNSTPPAIIPTQPRIPQMTVNAYLTHTKNQSSSFRTFFFYRCWSEK